MVYQRCDLPWAEKDHMTTWSEDPHLEYGIDLYVVLVL